MLAMLSACKSFATVLQQAQPSKMQPVLAAAYGMLPIVLLALLTQQPALAQSDDDEIFSAGFEDPCGFRPSGPGPSLSSISLGDASAGSAITINGQWLEASAFRVFLAGPLPNRALQVELIIQDRQQDHIVATLNDPLRMGSYDVVLQTCIDDIVLAGAYATPAFVSAFAEPGEQVVMAGAAFGAETGSIVVDETGDALQAGIVNWRDNEIVLAVDQGHDSNGAQDVMVSAQSGMLRLIDALVIHGVDNADDDEGPSLVSANATSNTSVIAQFSEAIVGGPDGAEDPTLYSITAPARFPTVNVLAAQVLPPDYTRVRLTTMSQSNLIYTLEVSAIKDLAGNPLASPELGNDPTQTDFTGIPPDGGDVIDSDGDGLTDAAEQSGWTVTVRRIDGSTFSQHVTSDPGDPRFPLDDPINLAARDSDNDGVLDFDEKTFSLNPRAADTDDDGLSDDAELNEIFSNPAEQDSDDDGLGDGLEFNFFKTSPILADTDGDQLTDDVEINLGNRNPLIADLPSPTIEVGESNLQLDVRFLESTSQSTDEIETRSVSSSLTQDSSRTVSNTNSNTQEAMAKLSVGTEYSVEASLTGPSASVTSSVNAEAGWTGSWTSSHTAESTQATQQAYQDSLEEQVAVSEGASVSREVVGASMQVTLSLKSTTNLAYFLRNLQVTALKQDQRNPSVLTPIATLLPDQEPPEGFSLGPLNPERGPIILSTSTIFPQQIEDLMRSPRGLIFKISNFDIVDELGRNFVFTSQDIVDRTATLVIDNGSFDEDGDGAGDLTEYVRVATGSGRVVDTNGDGVIDDNDRRIVFDASGRQVGVTLVDALDALGLQRYRENCPPGDDAPDCRPTGTLTDAEIENSYSVQREGPNGERERIFRIRNTAMDNINPKAWEVITPTGIDTTKNIDQLVLQTESDLKLAFVQDLDRDRITDGTEFLNGCSDTVVDTDGDGMDDRFEVLIGWDVETGSGTRRVFSRCNSEDSDGDGISDLEEAPANFTFEQGDADDPQLIAQATRLNADDFVTDPSRRDTDGDGVDDYDEINGYEVVLRGRNPECESTVTLYFNNLPDPLPDLSNTDCVFVTTNPNDPDTDNDGASDGLELDLGGNPTVSDIDDFSDADGDGLVNIVETEGWDVTIEVVSRSPSRCITACEPGLQVTMTVTSDPMVADTDFDGLLDSDEFVLRTHPGLDENSYPVECTEPPELPVPCGKDSDGDGLTDAQEIDGIEIRDLGIITLDPLDADTDNDKRSDGEEAELVDVEANRWIVRVVGEAPYRVFSDPTQADEDFDTLVDGDERTAGGTGSDPAIADTDGDDRSDAEEVAGSTNPLAEDFRVTVRYHRLNISRDCDTGNRGAGDIDFRLGVRPPQSFFGSTLVDSFSNQDDLGIDESCDDNGDGRIEGDEVHNTFCYRPAIVRDPNTGQEEIIERTRLIQLPDNTSLDFERYSRSFGVTANQEFNLTGFLRELDDGADSRLDLTLDDRFSQDLEIDGNMRNAFFLGSELRDGPIIGTFKNGAGDGDCEVTLEVSIVPEN
ncbi:MAG TPA: hypothetical protein VKO85_01935 [Wenzhouxiangellaceae bacterium]|nr:hypothetical protein [Wenzhouxiangellaceae bacterium]